MRPVIGLTGPTGAGKSAAAQALAAHGCAIVDADQAARAVTKNPDCLRRLAEVFGKDVVRPDGTLDRKLLAHRAFGSRAQEEQLNAVMHPLILAHMRAETAQALASGAPAVVLDAPLLLESGLDADCTAVVVVTAPPEVRLHRICARDGLTEAEARLRMSVQHPDDFYTARAQAVFVNDTTPEALYAAVASWFALFLRGEVRQ